VLSAIAVGGACAMRRNVQQAATESRDEHFSTFRSNLKALSLLILHGKSQQRSSYKHACTRSTRT
jgi:hypothetical protein